mgnify:CR=1 FL=1
MNNTGNDIGNKNFATTGFESIYKSLTVFIREIKIMVKELFAFFFLAQEKIKRMKCDEAQKENIGKLRYKIAQIIR